MRSLDSARSLVRFPNKLLTAIVVVVLAATIARADGGSEPISGLQIEGAVVTPAPKGGTAIAGFRIENLSSRSVTLIGARSVRSDAATIVIRSSGGSTEEATAVAIRPNEVLNLRSSHLWVEFRDLKEAIVPGEMLSFELIFASGTFSVEAHAHEGAIERW